MHRENPTDSGVKRFILLVPFTFFLFVLILSYYKLQVIENESYLQTARNNIVRSFELIPTRGDIYDKNHNLIVDSRPAYSIYIAPYIFKKDSALQEKLSFLMNDSLATEIMKKRVNKRYYRSHEKILVKRHISSELLAAIVENRSELQGVFVEVDPKRNRIADIKASHTIGYIKEITDRDLAKLSQYRAGDIIGKRGIEREYNTELFGTKGEKTYVADAYGNPVSELSDEFGYEKPPIDGKDLHLTLDVGLQFVAESLMVKKEGSVIALDVKTGGILAIVSAPTYDPEIMSKPIPQNVWNVLISKDKGEALLDRSVRGQYPPGSVYKMVALIAALNEGIVSSKWEITCTGNYELSDRTIHCWNREGHGDVNAITAISSSCNVYFFHLIQKIGHEKWVEYSNAFLFGSKTGVDLPSENGGLVPSPDFYNPSKKRFFSKGKLLNLSIGQGELLTTPLQIAQYTMLIANRGVYKRPHFLNGTADKYSTDITPIAYQNRQMPISVSKKVWDIVYKGMDRCVNGKTMSTGRNAHLADYIVLGKTGTAQVPPNQAHSWFVGFAPKDDPQIAVTVLVEHGGGGGAVAAPIARALFEKYFYGNVLRPRAYIRIKEEEPVELPAIPVLPIDNVIPYEPHERED